MDLPKDSNGYYVFNYPNGAESSYTSVEGFSNPMNRIFWGSEDTFSIDWMFNTYEEPIINYSTYADQFGNGQQLFYLSEESIGDTLMIVGYINKNTWDYLYFILD